MHLLEYTDCDLRVDLRRRQFRVSEHRLDEADVAAVLQHQRRHRVAEQVAGAVLAKVRLINVAAHSIRQPGQIERLAGARQEQRLIVRIDDQVTRGFPACGD